MISQRRQAKVVVRPVWVLLGADNPQLKHRVLRNVTQRLAVGETFKHVMNCRYSQNDSNSKSAYTLLATSKDFLSGFGTS
jgi:hypothetical protein